jgi:TRAP-type uncharacterized transport system substrate-binding protein
MEGFGMSNSDFALATEFKGSEQSKALCDSKIDAMVYAMSHAAAALKELATTCDVSLVSVIGADRQAECRQCLLPHRHRWHT